jgi:hypothetical protein
MNNKYYDGSEKTSWQKPKATKKSVTSKILNGTGSVLGLVVGLITGKGLYDKFKGK